MVVKLKDSLLGLYVGDRRVVLLRPALYRLVFLVIIVTETVEVPLLVVCHIGI